MNSRLYCLLTFIVAIIFAAQRTLPLLDEDSTPASKLPRSQTVLELPNDSEDASGIGKEPKSTTCPACSACPACTAGTLAPETTCPKRTKRSPPQSEETSWYRCLNQPRQPGDTRCYFQNVCVRDDSTILFYNGDAKQPSWRKPLVYYDKMCEFSGTPQIVKEPIPSDAEWYPGVVVYFRPYMPVNFGHALDDNFFATFRLLRMFGMEWDKDVAFLTQDHRDCSENEMASKGFDPDDSHCEHLKELGTFFGKGTWSAKEPPENWRTKSGKSILFCARHLLAGTSKLGMKYDLELVHDKFVEHILCRLNLDPQAPLPSPPRIAIFEKRHRRRTLNNAEIAKAIKDDLDIEADIVDIARYTFPEQVKLMQKYSLVISPSGGISFTGQFLPPGGAVIYTGGWNAETNKSAAMDKHLMSTRLRVADFYYPLEFGDLRVNDTLRRQEQAGSRQRAEDEEVAFERYRNFVDIKVSIPRMLETVKEALKSLPNSY